VPSIGRLAAETRPRPAAIVVSFSNKKEAAVAATDMIQDPFRELAHRATDGVDVVLFWHERTDELTVTVSDGRTGAYFELAADPASALDVFDHPYAYAAARGLPYADALLANWADASAGESDPIADPAGDPTT
jgi:hypothetical protein